MSMPRIAKHIQKLFVGNLSWTISNRELKQYFSKYGHVSSASVVFDKNSGISRGYGFVTFSSRNGYESASNTKHHSLEGRVLNIQMASA